MKRRQVLRTPVLALAVAAAPSVLAGGGDKVDFSRAVYDEAIASGEPFMLDFYASW